MVAEENSTLLRETLSLSLGGLMGGGSGGSGSGGATPGGATPGGAAAKPPGAAGGKPDPRASEFF